MPDNLTLEERIDILIKPLGVIVKKRMFGGMGYMIRGNMCFGIHKEYFVLRTSKDKADELLKKEHYSPFDITGSPMKGWLLVSPDILETDEQLIKMMKIGRNFANSLPKK